ncbi:MAG: DUF309 domain-containing protein [Nitrososphaerota archaeon]|nr:DUF309 domain-containing protein [Nitrososphaerota archaeon]MDG6939907.1 DUF309 domain-containing protein [Nitrososphaerota archaeon]
MRFLVRVPNPGLAQSKDDRALVKSRLKGAAVEVGDVRISSRSIEFDVFCRSAGEVRAALRRAAMGRATAVRRLDVAPRARGEAEALDEALGLYAEERFWEAHEALEGAWREKRDAREKAVLQCLILVFAAYVHVQRGEPAVALRMMGRAARGARAGSYLGIDVAALKRALLEAVREGSVGRMPIPRKADSFK